MTKKRAITVRMLKVHVGDPTDALKDGHRLQEIALSDAPDNKRLFAGQAYSNPPKWLSFFDDVDREKMGNLFGAAPAAILFMSVAPKTTTGTRSSAGSPSASEWAFKRFG